MQAMQDCSLSLGSKDTPLLLASAIFLQINLAGSVQDIYRTHVAEYTGADPRGEPIVIPLPAQTPIPHLSIGSGYGCSYCPLVSESIKSMQQHYNSTHAEKQRGRSGRKSSGSRAVCELLQQEHFGGGPPWVAVKFQRFFRSGPGSAGFRVREDHIERTEPRSQETVVGTEEGTECNSVANKVFQTLATLQAEQATVDSSFSYVPISSQVSPWLERTRWTSYLNGTCLRDAARLARLPDKGESTLTEITSSIDRLTDAAYTSVLL